MNHQGGSSQKHYHLRPLAVEELEHIAEWYQDPEDLSLIESRLPVPLNVRTAVDQQLASSGISRCRVTLEHNVGVSPGPVTLSSGTCDCDPPATALPPRREYVRVTVCVPLTELTPDLLNMFGVDLSGCIVQHSTTFRYEL